MKHIKTVGNNDINCDEPSLSENNNGFMRRSSNPVEEDEKSPLVSTTSGSLIESMSDRNNRMITTDVIPFIYHNGNLIHMLRCQQYSIEKATVQWKEWVQWRNGKAYLPTYYNILV